MFLCSFNAGTLLPALSELRVHEQFMPAAKAPSGAGAAAAGRLPEALVGSQLERMLAGDGRLARHAQHHSRAHMKAMKVAISNGLNFDQAHRWALLRVGR